MNINTLYLQCDTETHYPQIRTVPAKLGLMIKLTFLEKLNPSENFTRKTLNCDLI